MATLFVGIIALIGLIVAGFFLPVLWIVAAVLLVVGLIYVWQIAREGVRRAEDR
jgi:hypothetical protein